MTTHNKKEKVLPGEASGMDKSALICDLVMLGIFVWNQLRYGMNMLFAIIPLAVIGVYLLLFGVLPETYCFTQTALEIRHKVRRTQLIAYEEVFNYEASSKDTFININQHNVVKIYYMAGKKKRVVSCRPCDVETFVEILKANCPEFDVPSQPSCLDVFLEDQETSEKGDN